MMKNSIPLFLTCGAIALSVATLPGCVVAPAPYAYQSNAVYQDTEPAPVIAYSAPPAPQVEVVGVAPAPGYFWISGIWLWEGGRHVWHPGHWSAPRPGYTWQPHHWHQEGNEWHMNGGHWVRR